MFAILVWTEVDLWNIPILSDTEINTFNEMMMEQNWTGKHYVKVANKLRVLARGDEFGSVCSCPIHVGSRTFFCI